MSYDGAVFATGDPRTDLVHEFATDRWFFRQYHVDGVLWRESTSYDSEQEAMESFPYDMTFEQWHL